MIINPTNLDLLYKNANLSFEGAYAQAEVWRDMVATTVPSSTKTNVYAWAKRIPGMTEFIGERAISSLDGRSYLLQNKKYQVTIGVLRDDIEDDNIGLYAAQFQQLGMEAKKHPDELLADFIVAAASSELCFDGQPFFDASHPVDMSDSSKGTYSNSLTSTPLTLENYATARATMASYRGENGKSLKVKPSVLMVPPQLEVKAKQIINGDMTAAAVGVNAATGGATNVLKNTATVLVVPELSNDATTWYLLDASKPIKPFVYQVRRPAEFVSMIDPANPQVWKSEEFFYSVTARYAVGCTLPFLALRAAA